MKIELLFPIAMIVQSLGASTVFFIKGIYDPAAYWLLAAGLSAIVTFQPFSR